jgi:hypothetical protein
VRVQTGAVNSSRESAPSDATQNRKHPNPRLPREWRNRRNERDEKKMTKRTKRTQFCPPPAPAPSRQFPRRPRDVGQDGILCADWQSAPPASHRSIPRRVKQRFLTKRTQFCPPPRSAQCSPSWTKISKTPLGRLAPAPTPRPGFAPRKTSQPQLLARFVPLEMDLLGSCECPPISISFETKWGRKSGNL